MDPSYPVLLSIFIFLFLVFLSVSAGKIVLNRFRLWKWKTTLSLKKHERTFQDLYQHVNGFTLSTAAREKNDAIEYLYGEIKFIPFIALLSLIQMDENTVFYDLGSGTGKAVIACAMVFKLRRYCGVELFFSLHQAACQQLKQLKQLPQYQANSDQIHFYHDDFLKINLDDANIIFINSSALIGDTWKKLKHRFEHLHQCHTIITTTKPLNIPHYKLIKKIETEMSWGFVQVFIHQRKI